jgi:protein SCO1/2
VALGIAGSTLVACSSSPPQPSAKVGETVDRPLTEAVSRANLVDQDGRHFTLGSLVGTTVFVSPFLTLCADVCPFTTGNLAQVQASLDAAKQAGVSKVIEFTVDPKRDSVARLAAYAKANGVSWTLARSDATGTAAMIKYFGYTAIPKPLSDSDVIDPLSGRPVTYDVVHSDGYAIIDASGRLRFINNATPHFHGLLPAKLRAFLSKEGLDTLRKPDPEGWRPAGALEALSWVMGTEIPVAAIR